MTEPVTAVQTARIGVFLEWDRDETCADIAEAHDMSLDEAREIWDRELRTFQEGEIADSHDEALDAEALRQEHRAV